MPTCHSCREELSSRWGLVAAKRLAAASGRCHLMASSKRGSGATRHPAAAGHGLAAAGHGLAVAGGGHRGFTGMAEHREAEHGAAKQPVAISGISAGTAKHEGAARRSFNIVRPCGVPPLPDLVVALSAGSASLSREVAWSQVTGGVLLRIHPCSGQQWGPGQFHGMM